MDDNGRGAVYSLSAFVFLLLVHAAAAADDSAIMSTLLEGFSSAPQGWSSRTSYCKWSGVSCDSSSHVTAIDLASMSLSGTLPSDLSSLSRLKSLSLQQNSLSGSIPSFANLTSLEEIFLDNNNFTDVPSGVFQGLTSLQTLSVSYNPNLKPWTIPEDLNQSSGLVTFYASSANITGSVPDFFSLLPSLQHVRLSYNNLNGSLPTSLGDSSIQILWLNNQGQGLSGTLNVLSKMTQLTQAWLHVNQFTGPIPDLSKCESLFDLQLRDNLLTGIVPASLISLPSIQNVSLDNNKLQGPVPSNPKNIQLTYAGVNTFCRASPGPCDPQVTTLLEVAGALGYPMMLANSWAGNDACKDWSFVTCQDNKVTSVALSKQHFVGTISPSFGNLTSLRTLLLNDNNLTGSIPDSLAKLPNLEILDVSNNNLSGLVPTFPSKVKLTTSGNPLLGKKISTSGGSASASASLSSSISGGAIAGIVIVLLIFSGVILFILFRCFSAKLRNWKSKRMNSPMYKVKSANHQAKEPLNQGDIGKSNIPIVDNGNVMISIQFLRQVTNNFSPSNIIGRGGFGTVYKGEYEVGLEIAVKRMESTAMSSKGINEFQAEIAVLTQVRHRHLVALLGFCINGNERLLVYEYMPGGTLSQHLFEWQQRRSSPLSWKQRLTIAVDVARGVEYLHSLAQQSFIHRDLKPSNILLGDDMRAKVADFGLVRNAPDGNYSVETRLAGTFGYLAPEYAGISISIVLNNLVKFLFVVVKRLL